MNAPRMPFPPKRETVHVFSLGGGHVLDGRDCWCLPKVEHGSCADIVIHNEYAAGVKRPTREC